MRRGAIFFIFVILCIFFIHMSFASQDNIRVNNGQTSGQVNVGSYCRTITNAAGADAYIPIDHAPSWDDLVANNRFPAGITPNACCTPNSYSACSSGDRYWYDSCNNIGAMREDCACGCSSDTCQGASTWYLDADGDGYTPTSSVVQCSSPGAGWSTTPKTIGDCDDANAAIKPGASEVCDNVDNDCDSSVDEGFGYTRPFSTQAYSACPVVGQAIYWYNSCDVVTGTRDGCPGNLYRCVDANTLVRTSGGCAGGPTGCLDDAPINCPYGCAGSDPNAYCNSPPPQTCGNNIKEGTEVCDGSDPGPQACTTGGGYSGTQSCNGTCDGWNACSSTQYCGDGVINGPEMCDGEAYPYNSCQDPMGTQGCSYNRIPEMGCNMANCGEIVRFACVFDSGLPYC